MKESQRTTAMTAFLSVLYAVLGGLAIFNGLAGNAVAASVCGGVVIGRLMFAVLLEAPEDGRP